MGQFEGLRLKRESTGTKFYPLSIVRPGDSTRLVNLKDLFEVKTKVERPGSVYPGVFGRPIETVGSGVTYRLGNVAVAQFFDGEDLTPRERAWPHEGGNQARRPRTRSHARFIDMSGPGNLPPYDSLSLICVSVDTPTGVNLEDRHVAVRTAALRVVDRLAWTARPAFRHRGSCTRPR